MAKNSLDFVLVTFLAAYFEPMFFFYTTWRFPDVFRVCKKGAIALNGRVSNMFFSERVLPGADV